MHPHAMTHGRRSLPVWRAVALLSSAVAVVCWGLRLMETPSSSGATEGGATESATREPAESRPLATSAERARSELNAETESEAPNAVQALIASVSQSSDTENSAALEQLAQLGGERARQFLERGFRQARDHNLVIFAEALATLGDAEARQMLRDATRSARAASRLAALGALNGLDTADVRDFMVSALDGPNSVQAAAYFLDCREPRALPALERLARSAASDARQAAVDALLAQGASGQPALHRLLREDSALADALLARPAPSGLYPALRQASIVRLRRGAVASSDLFAFLAADLDREARVALAQAAQDPDNAELALDALSARGDPESLRVLDRLTRDSERAVSVRASCALISRPDSRSVRFLPSAKGRQFALQVSAARNSVNAAARLGQSG